MRRTTNQNHYLKDTILIAVTFIVAMMLAIIPLPHGLVWARPQWVFLVIMFWILAAPHRVGIGSAWIAGLFVDLLQGNLLGLHAGVLSIIAYLVIKFHPHMRTSALIQQTVMILVLAMLNSALQYWLLSLVAAEPDTWLYWLPPLTSGFFWPFVYLLLDSYQSYFGIRYLKGAS